MHIYFKTASEPPHDKTNKMACVPSDDSDQPGHPPSLIRVFAVCMQKAWVLSYLVANLRQKQNSLTFHWLFSDQIQFFTDQNIAVLQPICLVAADKWQIPFTSSLKCTSLILQMKQIKSLNSFLAQNILKLTSFHTFEWAKRAREIINTFQVLKIPATTYILGQNYEIPWLFPDFLGI